ncbi:MAG TPA: Arc family DNA-binding protein [Rhodocyclaceae bacterium]|nr:Arc family DNA-binding protein [Rhodocyclaceae bacterium]
MQGSSKMNPLGVRIPDELRQWLKHQAVDNRRSLNAEIVVRLEESRRRQELGAMDTKKKG